MLYEISEVCDKIALINYGKIIGFDTVDNLALTLKTSEINCLLLNPIPPEKLAPLLNRLVERLNPYLDQNLDPNTSKIPIRYNPEHKGLKFYFDGKKESKGEILKILIREFESDFTVISFVQPRTNQLERVYTQMVKENTPEGTIKLTGDDS
jgi:ABC-type multidrug transport system ATPase subunit